VTRHFAGIELRKTNRCFPLKPVVFRFNLYRQPKRFTDDLTGIVVGARINLSFDQFFQFRRLKPGSLRSISLRGSVVLPECAFPALQPMFWLPRETSPVSCAGIFKCVEI
jgi:hypothetical protein